MKRTHHTSRLVKTEVGVNGDSVVHLYRGQGGPYHILSSTPKHIKTDFTGYRISYNSVGAPWSFVEDSLIRLYVKVIRGRNDRSCSKGIGESR